MTYSHSKAINKYEYDLLTKIQMSIVELAFYHVL